MSLILTGKVVQGTQAASGQKHWTKEGGTIRMQDKFFAQAGINLKEFYTGTINVSIAPNHFSIEQADHFVPGVLWNPQKTPENFSFVKCLIGLRNHYCPAFLYYPHPETKIGTFPGHDIMEILTTYMSGIRYGETVELIFSEGKIRIVSTSLCT